MRGVVERRAGHPGLQIFYPGFWPDVATLHIAQVPYQEREFGHESALFASEPSPLREVNGDRRLRGADGRSVCPEYDQSDVWPPCGAALNRRAVRVSS